MITQFLRINFFLRIKKNENLKSCDFTTPTIQSKHASSLYFYM